MKHPLYCVPSTSPTFSVDPLEERHLGMYIPRRPWRNLHTLEAESHTVVFSCMDASFARDQSRTLIRRLRQRVHVCSIVAGGYGELDGTTKACKQKLDCKVLP